MGEGLADRIAEPLELYWGHQTLSRTTTMTIFELREPRYQRKKSNRYDIVCVLETPMTLQPMARSLRVLTPLSIFAVKLTTPYILNEKSWLAAVFKESP